MEISIIQWNIWYNEKIENVAAFLLKNKADIICLQELTLNSPDQNFKNTPKYISEKLGYTYFCKTVPIQSTEGVKMELANAIFSKFPLLSTSSAWINESLKEGGYEDEYRVYVEVKLKVGDKKVEVGTTHMSYTDKFTDTNRKSQETDRLLKIIRTKKSNYIFTGDLNSQPNSYTIKSLSNLLKDTGPDIKEKTWTTKPFSYRGFEESNLKWRLDYVFSSPDIKKVSSEIIQTSLSDHLPILAKFNL